MRTLCLISGLSLSLSIPAAVLAESEVLYSNEQVSELGDAYTSAVDLHSRLACEVYKIDEVVDTLSLKIARVRRILRKSGHFNGKMRSRVRALERDAFLMKSLRIQSRAPLVGGECPYKPPAELFYLPE